MNAQLQTIEPKDRPIATVDTSPAAMLRLAVERGADMAQIEKFMDLAERWEANNARKAYVSAMAAFKAEPLTITKDKHVSFTTQKGKTEYDHATIGNVVNTIVAGLALHGFSHRWSLSQDAGKIVVTCVITHQLGHSESTMMSAGADDSGGKNSIQAIASTTTYLQRYTLLAATGMATSDQEDDDGKQYGQAENPAAVALIEKIKMCQSIADLKRVKAEIKDAGLEGATSAQVIGEYNAKRRELDPLDPPK